MAAPCGKSPRSEFLNIKIHPKDPIKKNLQGNFWSHVLSSLSLSPIFEWLFGWTKMTYIKRTHKIYKMNRQRSPHVPTQSRVHSLILLVGQRSRLDCPDWDIAAAGQARLKQNRWHGLLGRMSAAIWARRVCFQRWANAIPVEDVWARQHHQSCKVILRRQAHRALLIAQALYVWEAAHLPGIEIQASVGCV